MIITNGSFRSRVEKKQVGQKEKKEKSMFCREKQHYRVSSGSPVVKQAGTFKETASIKEKALYALGVRLHPAKPLIYGRSKQSDSYSQEVN